MVLSLMNLYKELYSEQKFVFFVCYKGMCHTIVQNKPLENNFADFVVVLSYW